MDALWSVVPADVAAFALVAVGLSAVAAKRRAVRDNPIHIPDPARLQAKIDALVAGGRSELTVVADFDRTLTRNRLPNGERGMSCHGIVESFTKLSQRYRDLTSALFRKYFPIEISPHVSMADKVPMMRKWYAENHRALAAEHITRADIVSAVAGSNAQLRPGAAALLASCSRTGVPLLVFSAGIKDVIEEVIAQRYGALPAGLHVVSNKMAWSDDGSHVGFHAPLIHMFNKNESHVIGTPWFREAGARRNALVLGDSLGDAGMAGEEGERHATVLRVGFLNEVEAEGALLERYSDAFDVVVLRDASMDFVLERILAPVLKAEAHE